MSKFITVKYRVSASYSSRQLEIDTMEGHFEMDPERIKSFADNVHAMDVVCVESDLSLKEFEETGEFKVDLSAPSLNITDLDPEKIYPGLLFVGGYHLWFEDSKFYVSETMCFDAVSGAIKWLYDLYLQEKSNKV